MTLFEWLSVIFLAIGGLWVAGAALITLAAKHKERADTADRKSLTDSVESVRELARSAKSETMSEVRTLMARIEDTTRILFSKFDSADRSLTKHEIELAKLFDRFDSQQREFSKEFERVWKSIQEGQSRIKELGEGYLRVTDHRKKTD